MKVYKLEMHSYIITGWNWGGMVGCPADLQVWNFIYLHVNSENMGKISDKNQILGQNYD